MGEYVYSHYPLARYLDGVHKSVANEEEEAAAKAEGWIDWHSDQARMAEQTSDSALEPAESAPEVLKVQVEALPLETEAPRERKKPGPKPKIKV